MVEGKVIITAALTGAVTSKDQNPNVPYTPEEFADVVAKCYKEGASIVHIHARRPDNGAPTPDIKLIQNVLVAVKKKTPEIIINLSTAIAPVVTDKERITPVVKFKPPIASLNTNSMNFGVGDWNTGKVVQEIIFENMFKTITSFAKKMKDAGTKPEIEVYDFGGMYNILFLQKSGLLAEPLHFQFVFGVLGGIPFSVHNLAHLLELKPPSATWSVCGVSKNQFQAAACAVLQGGHIRVGLEDNIKMPNGELAKGSHEQVAWTRQLVEHVGLKAATPEETRQILGLKKLTDETPPADVKPDEKKSDDKEK
nr:3-keto-5-aminohexanoate cleavage protein [Candidatus Sigynarchaeota archaeon]